MSDWIAFEGRIVPMEWGDCVYTVLPLPRSVMDVLAVQGAKRVDVELNDCAFNMALTKAPVIDHIFVYTGKRVLQDAGLEPAEPFEARVRMADPNLVETPDDVALAIRQNDLTPAWNVLSPGKKRGLLHTVTTAKRAETRAARIAKLIDALRTV